MNTGLRIVTLMAAGLATMAQTAPTPTATPDPAAPRDWQATLRSDADAFRDLILDSHPGPHDTDNPGFSAHLNASHAAAIARAQAGIGYRDYYWAMTEFGHAFDDGHLGVYPANRDYQHDWAFTWPGFATAFADGRHRVAISEAAGAPPVGAMLIACDGIDAEAFAADRLGPSVGRWMLAATRARTGARLFLRSDIPWRKEAKQCRFEVAGRSLDYNLSWSPIDRVRRTELLNQLTGTRANAGIGISAMPRGGMRIALGSFESDPNSEDGRKLTELVEAATRQGPALQAAPVRLFDLRGNNGGSSAWIYRVANVIWGKERTDAAAPRNAGVDYRVSAANIDHFQAFSDQIGAGADPQTLAWLKAIIDGMRRARSEGKLFWRPPADDEPAAAPNAGGNAVIGNTYVFTDFGCASACLDAVDLLVGLGAVHVGQETSADTQYMEIREQSLPSGLMIAYLPTKVYRGRPRGANEPARPVHRWQGALDDEAGIVSWVETLPRQ